MSLLCTMEMVDNNYKYWGSIIHFYTCLVVRHILHTSLLIGPLSNCTNHACTYYIYIYLDGKVFNQIEQPFYGLVEKKLGRKTLFQDSFLHTKALIDHKSWFFPLVISFQSLENYP